MLQLTLVQPGYGCGVAPSGSMPMPAPTTMPMGDGQMGMAQPPRDASSRSESDHQAPCRLPWVPDGCQAMAPCAPSAVVTAPVSLPQLTLAPADMRILAVLEPSSVSYLPELPPPRA